MTEWKAQIGNGKFSIQFETSRYDLYKEVEKACQNAVDKSEKDKTKERASQMRSVGHI